MNGMTCVFDFQQLKIKRHNFNRWSQYLQPLRMFGSIFVVFGLKNNYNQFICNSRNMWMLMCFTFTH